MMDLKNENLNLKEYFEQIVETSIGIFNELTSWSDDDKKEYSLLLSELKKPFNKEIETTKSKGDRLENLVSFIIKKTFFFYCLYIYRKSKQPNLNKEDNTE